MMRGLAVACATIALVTARVHAQDPDRAQVIAAVQTLFDAMEKGDTELASKTLMPEARFFSAAERAMWTVERTGCPPSPLGSPR